MSAAAGVEEVPMVFSESACRVDPAAGWAGILLREARSADELPASVPVTCYVADEAVGRATDLRVTPGGLWGRLELDADFLELAKTKRYVYVYAYVSHAGGACPPMAGYHLRRVNAVHIYPVAAEFESKSP